MTRYRASFLINRYRNDERISNKAQESLMRYTTFMDEHGVQIGESFSILRDVTESFVNSETSFKPRTDFTFWKKLLMDFFAFIHENEGATFMRLNLRLRYHPDPEALQLSLQKQQARRVQFLNEDEVMKILAYTKENYTLVYVPFLMMYNFALRISDLINIKRRHFVTGTNGQFYLYMYGKGEKMRGTPTMLQIDPPELFWMCMEHFGHRNNPDDTLLAIRYHWQRCGNDMKKITRRAVLYSPSRMTMHKLFKQIVKEAIGREVSTHFFRRSKASNEILRGTDVHKILNLTRIQSEHTLRLAYDVTNNHHNLGAHAIIPA